MWPEDDTEDTTVVPSADINAFTLPYGSQIPATRDEAMKQQLAQIEAIRNLQLKKVKETNVPESTDWSRAIAKMVLGALPIVLGKAIAGNAGGAAGAKGALTGLTFMQQEDEKRKAKQEAQTRAELAMLGDSGKSLAAGVNKNAEATYSLADKQKLADESFEREKERIGLQEASSVRVKQTPSYDDTHPKAEGKLKPPPGALLDLYKQQKDALKSVAQAKEVEQQLAKLPQNESYANSWGRWVEAKVLPSSEAADLKRKMDKAIFAALKPNFPGNLSDQEREALQSAMGGSAGVKISTIRDIFIKAQSNAIEFANNSQKILTDAGYDVPIKPLTLDGGNLGSLSREEKIQRALAVRRGE